MQRSFARHEAILRQAMAEHGGFVYKMIGDAFQVAFSSAPQAVEAALAAQRSLTAEPWGEVQVRVRMALHTGVTEERQAVSSTDTDYFGPTLNRVARLLDAAHGGQVLLNQTTYELACDHLPEGASLRSLGEHNLKDLIQPEQIYQLVAPGLPADFPPLRTAGVPIHLPAQMTPFIGRKAELAEISSVLINPDCRLVSLIGIGGSGKTRLAIEAAQAAGQGQAFPHGVYFVDLAPVASLEGMLSAIASALRFSFYNPSRTTPTAQEAQAQLLNYLAGKRALLILDNFEQLTSSADFLFELLQAAAQVRLIVTSRERLNLPGEWALPVFGLACPNSLEGAAWFIGADISHYAAVQLFQESAGRGAPFTPAAADWPAIGRICRLVEGLPLALELAAAWIKVLSCQEIAAAIEKDLDFLAPARRGVHERHRTLRAVFDYSWRLLPEAEQKALIGLSIFHGGFTREAAQEVAGASTLMLSALSDKSFLRRTSSGRFSIHPVLRQYVGEKLSAQAELLEETQARHAGFYSKWMEIAYEKLKGPEQLNALAAMRTEAPNLLAAFGWMLNRGDFAHLQRSILPMLLFYEMDDQRVQMQELVWILGKLLSVLKPLPKPSEGKPTESTPASEYLDLYALTSAALRRFVGRASGQWEQSELFQEDSLIIASQLPDSPAKAFALLVDAIGPGILTPRQAIALGKQCIGIFERLDDAWEAALARIVVGDIYLFGEISAEIAHPYYQASLETFTRLGNDWGRAMCLTGLAEIERRAGHAELALQLGRQSLEILQQMNSQERMILNRQILGLAARDQGMVAEARDYFQANLDYLTQVGDAAWQKHTQELLSELGK